MQVKICIILTLITLAATRTYPLYRQCDSRWGSEQLGTSANNICKAGSLLSSVAMALTGTGRSYTPSTLNSWLKGHGGFVNGDLFVWGSVGPLGFSYVGKVSNSNIDQALDAGDVVILNVHNGAHQVLATAISGSTISVNDPGYSTTSYGLSEIVAGQSGLYRPSSILFHHNLESFLNVHNKRQHEAGHLEE